MSEAMTYKLPPLPETGYMMGGKGYSGSQMQAYAIAAIEAQGVPDVADLIAGALYDFLGHLTSMEKSISFGANEWATPAVDALIQFAEKRRLTLNNPAIESWTESLASAPPAPQADKLVKCSYGDNGYACCEGGPCAADVHNNSVLASVVQQEPVDFIVSVVVIKITPTGYNTQNKLYPVTAVSREEAHGKALNLAGDDFPKHNLHTICSYQVQQAKPLSADRDARIAELEQRNRDLHEDVKRFRNHALNEKDARMALERELAEARKDAERWNMTVEIGKDVLRHPNNRKSPESVAAYMAAINKGYDMTHAIDEAIDAAMKGKQ